MSESPAPPKTKSATVKEFLYDTFRLFLTAFLGISHPNDYKHQPPRDGK